MSNCIVIRNDDMKKLLEDKPVYFNIKGTKYTLCTEGHIVKLMEEGVFEIGEKGDK